MDNECEAALRKQLAPVADEIRALYLDAMVLRVDVFMMLADEAGAEAEDVPGIVENAVTTSTQLMMAAIAVISEAERSREIVKRLGL